VYLGIDTSWPIVKTGTAPKNSSYNNNKEKERRERF
jgi:hypothetical protein